MNFSDGFKGFMDEIYSFVISHNGTTTMFRGQKSDLPLNAGIFRMHELGDIETVKRKEENAYRMFINLGAPFLKSEVDWQLLFVMQHHGTKTRLLD